MPETKQVFQMRKEGKLVEALTLARQLFAQTPLDPWVIKAYGWTLHDCLKTAKGPNTGEVMREFFAEFEKLQIPENDELLLKCRENWRAKIPSSNNAIPLYDLLQQAKQASGAGNRPEALRLHREALKSYPEAPQASMNLGWEIQRALKELVSKKTIDSQSVRKLLLEYARIPHVEKPSNLHSLILTRAAQAAKKEKLPNFIRFFKWWNPSNLQASDFERFTPEDADRSFDSLVEQVIRSIHKSSDTEQNKENIAWAADFVGKHYDKFPEQEWFPYYYGQLLVKSGDLERARHLIIQIVRRKKGEFWVWENLAATYTQDDNDKRLACLCKSLLCHVKEEKFLVNVRAELGKLLAAIGNHAAAKYEIARSIEIRESQKPNPWRIPPALKTLQSSEWYVQTKAPKSNKLLYEAYAPAADALIYEGVPEFKGILMHKLPPSDGRPGISFIAYENKGRTEQARVKTKYFDCLNDAKIGSPFTVQIDDSAGQLLVVAVHPRDGAPWDIIPENIGVVRRVNMKKGVTAVILGKDDSCLLYHTRFPQAKSLHVGDFVAVKLRKDTKRDKMIVQSFTVTDQEPSSEFFRHYKGTLDQVPERQFGFINHKIFVPPDLVDGTTIVWGISVTGTAVLELDKVKNSYGWRAVTIEPV